MNLVIDPFRDKILLYNAGNKKIPDFWYKKDFDYSLEPLQNQQKALTELVKDDDSLRKSFPRALMSSSPMMAWALGCSIFLL